MLKSREAPQPISRQRATALSAGGDNVDKLKVCFDARFSITFAGRRLVSVPMPTVYVPRQPDRYAAARQRFRPRGARSHLEQSSLETHTICSLGIRDRPSSQPSDGTELAKTDYFWSLRPKFLDVFAPNVRKSPKFSEKYHAATI